MPLLVWYLFLCFKGPSEVRHSNANARWRQGPCSVFFVRMYFFLFSEYDLSQMGQVESEHSSSFGHGYTCGKKKQRKQLKLCLNGHYLFLVPEKEVCKFFSEAVWYWWCRTRQLGRQSCWVTYGYPQSRLSNPNLLIQPMSSCLTCFCTAMQMSLRFICYAQAVLQMASPVPDPRFLDMMVAELKCEGYWLVVIPRVWMEPKKTKPSKKNT